MTARVRLAETPTCVRVSSRRLGEYAITELEPFMRGRPMRGRVTAEQLARLA